MPRGKRIKNGSLVEVNFADGSSMKGTISDSSVGAVGLKDVTFTQDVTARGQREISYCEIPKTAFMYIELLK